MKKIMIILFFFGAVWAYGMNTCLIITSPKPGDTWFKGETRTISWINQGNKSAGVKINIFRNSINQANFVQQLTGPVTGSVPWKIPSDLKPGPYQLRIKAVDGSCMEDSPVFTVHDSIKIIQVQPLIPDPPPSHRAPPVGEPSQASFNIQTIYYNIGKDGRIGLVKVVVGYQSTTPFSFSKYQGDPKDGPVYMNCKIMLPYWPDDLWPDDSKSKGPFKVKDIYNQRLSLKYSDQNNLKCIPDRLNAGTGNFELRFSPAHSDKAKWLFTRTRMPGSSPWQGHTEFCIKKYPIKMALRLFVHTKEGVKQAYKEFYLYGDLVKSVTIPGEVNICSSGTINW